ncbi:MAG: hypothetical protein GY811_12660 [Myxococcales bacterium]|nr:hypothetical protein [Myxococcales bacterium]
MVAYEDLVVALTNWRMNQGLPTGADAFAAFETGSVDLALPVADPVDVTTGEVLAIDGEGIIEEVAEGAIEEDAAGIEQAALVSETESEAPFEAASDEILEEAEASYEGEHELGYGDETAYGDTPQMADLTKLQEPLAPTNESETDEVSADADAVDSTYEFADQDQPQQETIDAEDVRFEEVDVLAAEEEIDAASDEIPVDDMPVEELAADDLLVEEEIASDDMDVQVFEEEALPLEEVGAEEVNADDFDAVADDNFDDEAPTKFGNDNESTITSIGVDEIVPPRKG